MAIMIAISDEERENGGPKPKKQRIMDSDETQEDEEAQDHEPVEEDEEETQEPDDGEEEYGEEEVIEDDTSTETLKLDEDEDEDHEEDDETKEDNKSKFYLTDLEIFDCTVCLQRLSVPLVYLCEDEHLVCSTCFSSSSVCTICSPSTSYKRSRMLEKILKSIGQSCENLEQGCKRPVHFTMKADHEKYCKFGPCLCPIQGCDFNAPSFQLSGHLGSEHPNSFTHFSFDQLYSIKFGPDEMVCVLQETDHGDVFVVRNVVHDIGNMIGICQIGPISFRSQFCLDLEAKDGKRQSLRFKGKIESVRRLVGEALLMRDFLLVPRVYFEAVMRGSSYGSGYHDLVLDSAKYLCRYFRI